MKDESLLPKSRLLLTIACMAVGATGCSSPPRAMPPSAPHPLAGMAAPPFQRTSLAGHTVGTRAGGVVVVKFFARYCAPCVRTLPEAERVHRARPNVVFVGIDEDDSEVVARELVDKYGLTFPVVLDQDNVLSGRFRVTELPIVFVIDRAGAIRWVGGESTTEAGLLAAIDATK